MKKLQYLVFLCFLTTQAYSQCPDFQIVANKSSVCAPEIIRFEVLNSVAGSAYEWNVGNGVVFGADTLFSFYTSPLTINATVTITLPGGAVCNVSNNAIAVVNAIPIPNFTATKSVLCDGADSITLSDVTPNSVSRSWIVDGSNYSNTGNVIGHKFVTLGSKKISLVVTDDKGCKGVKDFVDTIQIYSKPEFTFGTSVNSGCIPQTTSYILLNDPSVGSFTKKYYWDFPGSNNSIDSGKTPEDVIYNSIGNYDATLTVRVSNGCDYLYTNTNSIQLGETVDLGLSASSSSLCLGETISFSQTPNPHLGTLAWTFNGVETTVLSADNTSAQVQCSSIGDLDVTLVNDHNGCISTKTFNQIVTINGIKANFFSSDNYHCAVPHTVHLMNNTDSMDATIVNFKWRILDGNTEVNTSTLENSIFTFNTLPATYTAQLIVVGNHGCTDTMTRTNFIYQDSLIANFTVNPSKVCEDQVFTMNNATKPSTYMVPDEFLWYFYEKDGTTIADSSDLRQPSFSYSDTGYYNIQVIGYNSIGCRDTLLLDSALEVIQPNLNYTISNPIICKGEFFQLEGLSTPSDVSFTYTWRFENKNSSDFYSVVGQNTQISPSVLGEYKAISQHDIAGACIQSDTIDVYINGLVASINLDTSNGCAPLLVNPTVDITKDFYEGQSASGYTYQWSVLPSNGVLLSDSFSSTPTFQFSEDGDFVVSVTIINSAGCSYTSSSNTIITGVRGGVQILDNKICLGDSLSVLDNSFNGVTNVTWSLNPDTSSFTVTSISSNLSKILLDKVGVYELVQIVSNQNICYDTTYTSFEIIDVKADFIAVDSFLQCAPVFAEFESKSSNADTLIWDFGTGDIFKTTSSSAGIIYNKNSGWSDGYDISLVAKNIEGCTDTAFKYDYVVVAGPKPEFEMINFSGCEPLNVTFVDRSKDESYFFMNYNDGSLLDSTKNGDIINVHTYTIKSFTALRQTVMPSIIVYDSLGCASVFEPNDSIVILRSPSIDAYFANGTQLCTPFNIVFEDSGTFTNTRQWSMDGVDLSSQLGDSVVKVDGGNYNLRLISENSNSCTDTLEQEFIVFEKPIVSLTIDDTICINNLANFVGKLTSSVPVDNFEWTFGEASNPANTNTTSLSPGFTYTSAGLKEIKLIGGLTNGCSDSVIQTVVITDASDIDNPLIKYVTFKDNYTIEINYEKSTTSKFSKYLIASVNGLQEVTDIDQTSIELMFSEVPAITNCYTLQVSDYCDLLGLNSESHCFILLDVTSNVSYENELSWTPYLGWTEVSDYTIFRKDENDVFVKIASVAGDVYSFIDQGLCDNAYEYFVQASHPVESWLSNSHSVVQRPIYIRNPLSSSIKNVTVSNENEISIAWDQSSFSEFSNYKLLKYESSFDNLISEMDVTSEYFYDTDVLTNEHSYIYQVVEEDRCGYVNIPEREGKSILLRGFYFRNSSRLKWTEYQNWASGIKEHKVEVDNNGTFKGIGGTNSNDREFRDNQYRREIIGEYCYRVFALSNSGDTSYSNIVCISSDPIVIMPTGFTPNDDNLNDVFRPVSQFILEDMDRYSFTIYNRWGEKVFDTKDASLGWDGMYKGQKAQQGTYMYTIMASGIKKQKIFLDGSVTLLR
ncbi:MAG: hypothetical protein COA58_01950 [Bacteroidetes bacterium]|nr:MAG: hypothetical protein COA58_01950 [Bacteroidota bacterium]